MTAQDNNCDSSSLIIYSARLAMFDTIPYGFVVALTQV